MPRFEEKKTERLNVKLEPSLKEALKEKALQESKENSKITLSEYVRALIIEEISDNSDSVEKENKMKIAR